MTIKFSRPRLKPGASLKEIEEEMRRLWMEIDVRGLIAERRKGAPTIGFIEGPPTMNGEPHLGHIRGRMLKDLWFRLETMKGFRVIFRAGWDTQGLPVELQAERELGMAGSKAEVLERISAEKLVEACKDIVHKYNEIWMEADDLLGILLDYGRAYWTYEDRYIEREWKYLKRAWDDGILGEGYRVVAYCPSCQTSLSHSEVASSYEMLEDPSIYYKTRLVDEDVHLILWTTMPFTIVTDELVGVNPDADYVYTRVGDETWIVAEGRLEDLSKELDIEGYRVFKRVKGKELEGKRYMPPLLDEVPGQRTLLEQGVVHRIVAEDFVDTSTGTGLVHLSPANGEEDFEVARRRGLPIFNPIDDRVRFTEEAGKYSGKFVRDSDDEIVEDLRRKGLLIKADRIVHEYPVCWRSGHRLIFVARREYFYWVDRIVDRAIRASEKVEYYYQQPRNRFMGIIGEAKPWCISRERVWGTPLPVWVCSRCGHKFIVPSRKEILERAIELPDGPDFELHRPWMDRIVLKCPRCGGPAYREPFVLDTWHNSGAAPYSSLTDEEFEELIPVPFLTEGIDQTRGWAYSLLMENVVLTGRDEAPYRSFLFVGHVLDEKGEKMSKSKGNVIYAMDLFRESPVDVARYYLVWKTNPVDPMNFSRKEMRGRPFQVLNTIYNLFVFLSENGEYDGYRWRGERLHELVGNRNLRPQDRWLLSLSQRLVESVLISYERRRFHEAARELERFIIDVVSQRYVPLVRSELWEDSPETLPRRSAIYDTLAHVLLIVLKLLHPIAPYTTDYIYNAFYVEGASSLVVERAPISRSELLDEGLEMAFEAFWNIVSVANSARMRASIKRRWALREAHVYSPTGLPDDIKELLRQMLNVKELYLHEDPGRVPARLEVKPIISSLGERYRGDTRKVLGTLTKIDPWRLAMEIEEKGKAEVRAEGRSFEITEDDVEFRLEVPSGFSGAYRDRYAVVLNVMRDRELLDEGMIRDIARRIQVLRKERGYKPTDILEVVRLAGLSREMAEAVEDRMDILLHLVRVKRIEVLDGPEGPGRWSEFEIEGQKIFVDV